jgi:hypothetical protein
LIQIAGLTSQLKEAQANLEQEKADLQSELAYLTTQLNEEMLARQKVEQELSDVREESRLMQRKNAHALKVRVIGCNIRGGCSPWLLPGCLHSVVHVPDVCHSCQTLRIWPSNCSKRSEK